MPTLAELIPTMPTNTPAERRIKKACQMMEDFMNEDGNIHIALSTLKIELKRSGLKRNQIGAGILLDALFEYNADEEQLKFWKNVASLLPPILVDDEVD